jgi:ferredoxin-thioredoxin reductase catalytic subunit
MQVKKNPNWTKEQHDAFNEKLKGSGGYCPCSLIKSNDTKCICKEFRDKLDDPDFTGQCHCGRYVAIQ